MPPKVFREFGGHAPREKWPLEFDLAGVKRDNETRQAKLETKQYEDPMKTLSPNSFVSGKSIDLNRPPSVAYDPRQHQYPKMLYHQTKKDPNWLAEEKRVKLHNSLHPEKPEILPQVPAAFTIVHNPDEEEKAKAAEFADRPPAMAEVDEFADVRDEALCARGCGEPPHRGKCKAS